MAATATPKELREALQINVNKVQGEAGQRNSVIRSLAVLGHRRPPQVLNAKLDGSAIRLYLWSGSPAGELILATGPAFIPKILEASEIRQSGPGVYVLAGPDTTKAGQQAAKVAETWRPRVQASPPAIGKRDRGVVKRAVEKAAPAPAREVAFEVEKAERKELVDALKALLG